MNRFETGGLAFITPQQDAEMSPSRVRENDVLLNITGASIGRVCVVPNHLVPANVNQHVCIIRGDGSWMPRFLSYFLSTAEVQHSILADQAGATRQALTKTQIEDFEMPLPPLAEQERIAAWLTEQLAIVERARAAAQARLAAAEALRAAYLREVFEGSKASEWAAIPVSEICSVVEGQVDPRKAEYGALPHVNGENIEGGTGRILKVQSAAEDGLISGKYLFEPGMVLYSKLRPYLRKVAIAPFRGVCSADMYPLTFDLERVNNHFAMWSLLAGPFTRYAVKESERARMPKLNREQLFAWHMPLPPVDVQIRIAADLSRRLAEAERLTGLIREELAAIDALPAALLRQAFNGYSSSLNHRGRS